MTTPRLILVGEQNPHGSNPAHALYPHPRGCAGERLCRVVLGLREETYLRSFERRNLLTGTRWRTKEARSAARDLEVDLGPTPAVVVMLGNKVRMAFGMTLLEFFESAPDGHRYLALPHPSGRCTLWTDPANVRRAREALLRLAPHLPLGEADLSNAFAESNPPDYAAEAGGFVQ